MGLAGKIRSLAAALFVGFAGCSASPAPPPQAAPAARTSPPKSEAEPRDAANVVWPFGPVQTVEERNEQLGRLTRDIGPQKSNWVPPGKSVRYGHAESLISAPYASVRGRVVDFAHYKDLAGPKFRSVRVVDKLEASTDIYFQLPIMHGLVTLWYITRFATPRPIAGGGEVVEGTFVKGNIKDMHISFTIRPGVDEKNTVLTCDLLLLPSLPAPQSAVDEELRDACGDALNAVRRQTTGGS